MNRIEQWMTSMEGLAFIWNSTELEANDVKTVVSHLDASGYQMPELFHEWIRLGKEVGFSNSIHQGGYILDPRAVTDQFEIEVLPSRTRSVYVSLGIYHEHMILCSTDGNGLICGTNSPHWPAACVGTFQDLLQIAYEDMRTGALRDELRKETAPEFETTLDWFLFNQHLVEEMPDLFAPTFEDVVDQAATAFRKQSR